MSASTVGLGHGMNFFCAVIIGVAMVSQSPRVVRGTVQYSISDANMNWRSGAVSCLGIWTECLVRWQTERRRACLMCSERERTPSDRAQLNLPNDSNH